VGQDYRHQLAVSLIEDVTIGICRYRAVSVVAPHTAGQLSVGGKKTLFRTFGIDYAVETQLQNRGGEFWLAVKLLNAVSREIHWTEHYAFDLDPVARHYRDLSVQILTSVIDRIERLELSRYETEQNASAYHLYLSGQRYLRRLDLPNVRRARRAFRSAVGECPDFVPGISGLARTLQVEWLLRAHGDEEMLGEAERLAARSIDIDPDDARGYRELGVCHAYAGRFDESLQTLALGEQKNPQHADLLNDYADALVHACEPAAALQKIEQAIALNPLCPDQYWWAAAGANYQLEKYSQAVECMSRMRDQTPALRLLAASWGMLGDRLRAGEYAQMTKESHPDFRIGNWLSIVPFRDQRVIRKYAEGLRAAGFE
jgi:tetratricopeptide (TPR) repeat protein